MTTKLRTAWISVVAAAALNLTGMMLEASMGRPVPDVPQWPPIMSAAVGGILLVVLLLTRRRQSRWIVSAAFVLNTAAVTTAFYVTNPYYAAGLEHWVPFQGNKLACLLAALVAPSLTLGILSIAAHGGTAVYQYLEFPAETKAILPYDEPLVTVAFMLAGGITLAFRFARVALEDRLLKAQAEAAAMKRLARAFLHARDLMNTPLQTIELATGLLQQADGDAEKAPAYDALHRSIDRLRALSRLLSHYETNLDWKDEDMAFDAEESLRSLLEAPSPP